MNEQATAMLVAQVAQTLSLRGWMMATAESCTGGLIAARCTDLAGSSAWFERGFITYSNQAKSELLGVAAQDLAQYGAVSTQVAQAMAEGALQRSHAQVAVAVTGIAGPGGAVPGKPVGTVWLGWAWRSSEARPFHGAHTPGDTQRGDGPRPAESGTCLLQLVGDRAAVREATVQAALKKVLELAGA